MSAEFPASGDVLLSQHAQRQSRPMGFEEWAAQEGFSPRETVYREVKAAWSAGYLQAMVETMEAQERHLATVNPVEERKRWLKILV